MGNETIATSRGVRSVGDLKSLGWSILVAVAVVPLIATSVMRVHDTSESETFFVAGATVQNLKRASGYPERDLREKLSAIGGLNPQSPLDPRLSVERSGNGVGVSLAAAGVTWGACRQMVEDGVVDSIPGQLSVNDIPVHYDTEGGMDQGRGNCNRFGDNNVRLQLPL